jgi:hypothetical protein
MFGVDLFYVVLFHLLLILLFLAYWFRDTCSYPDECSCSDCANDIYY